MFYSGLIFKFKFIFGHEIKSSSKPVINICVRENCFQELVICPQRNSTEESKHIGKQEFLTDYGFSTHAINLERQV